jgi:hypothetical protein
MKTVNSLRLFCMTVAALVATLSAEAAEQQIAVPSPKSVAPQAASEDRRAMTVQCGNGGSVTFVVPPVKRTSFESASPAHVEKWKSVTLECGNGGLLTFLIPAGK